MAIYTKTGDKGTTSLFGGKRISKANIRVEAYGSADELTSFIGLVATKVPQKITRELLTTIQKDIYQIMAFLAGAKVDRETLRRQIKRFEREIDKVSSRLAKLNRFIVPGGTEFAGWFHVLRTVCRRLERAVVKSFKKPYNLDQSVVVQYFNRLSDLFFTLARWHSKGKEIVV
ncbi:cob(I)yrinic acid a,c-diamide adenosyltransferase [Candidatus Roizmanbacteria bacterium]|nr:cob(I)yrinic acid a,c-diamide adenosyltransferase [Candidatus Roizmanbacteria bacterium]